METWIEYLYGLILLILALLSCISLNGLMQDNAADEIFRGMDMMEKMKKINKKK